MKIAVIDNGTSLLSTLEHLLVGNEYEIVTLSEIDEISPKFDLIILSGSKSTSLLSHLNVFEKEMDLIRTTEIPVLGICLGFELIAYAFKSSLQKIPAREKGIISIEVMTRDKIFEDLNILSVYECHRWVVSKLPDCLEAMAKSEDGIEIIRHKEKKIYGFQFHPEMFRSHTDGAFVFRNLLKTL